MATDIDKPAIVKGLEQSVGTMHEAARFGQEIARKIDRLYYVGCGAPNRAMLGVEYWLQHHSPSIEVRRYFPAEFMSQNPARLDDRTLVVLGSKSGTTPETVAAARFCRELPCLTAGVTQTEDLPLAQALDHPFLLGPTEEAHTGMFMVLQAMAGGVQQARDGWPLLDKLLGSLEALPEVMADTQLMSDGRCAEYARIYKDDRILYHVAAGPAAMTAYVFGVCILMEMQWMHSYPIDAAEFFHGPFEIVDQSTPLILYKGEDPSRPLMDRVERFCKKYTERLMIFDSRDYAMSGIDPDIRPIVAPYVLEAAVLRLAHRLAVWHNHPLATRRYMWKTDY